MKRLAQGRACSGFCFASLDLAIKVEKRVLRQTVVAQGKGAQKMACGLPLFLRVMQIDTCVVVLKLVSGHLSQ